MQSKTQQTPRPPNHPNYLNEGLTTKKTALIVVTVIGCIAILWPKVFYPMMFGGGDTVPKTNSKDPHGSGGCCDVVLDREQFMNASAGVEYGPQLYRKQINIYTGEISIRQERPAHLHPDSIYHQAMRERGSAIVTTTPIVERQQPPPNKRPPRIVDGRPGPVPGMRPPMGAGGLHQPQSKGGSMGFIMPLYTIGIVVFFGYTIMKIVFKKPLPNAPYGPAPTDPKFRKHVFGQENGRHVEDLNGSQLVVTAIQGLIDAADKELNVRENKTTTDLSKEPNENFNSSKVDNISNEHTTNEHEGKSTSDEEPIREKIKVQEVDIMQKNRAGRQERKRRDVSTERSVTVLGMEVTASCEGGGKWTGRPPTPVFFSHNEHSRITDDLPEPQSIYLEGTLAHESQILVADSETKTEKVYDAELSGSAEEPAVVLSSKMTLSLIHLDSNRETAAEANNAEIESPLADDIEIIGHDEN